MIPTIYLHRFEFTMRFSQGIVIDVGVADGAQWRYPIPTDSVTNPPHITNIVVCDCDEWQSPYKFIRCFAENVPLPNLFADTIIYSDILEHVNDPNIVLQEGKRLTKDRILISVPNEWKWPKNDPNVKTFHTREYHLSQGKDLSKLGYDSTIKHPCGKCIDALDDIQFEHIHHKRFFNEETFTKLIEDNFDKKEWDWYIYNLKYSCFNF